MSTDQPGAGWHTDPLDSNRIRYHDGTRWTDHTADAPTLSAAPPEQAPGGGPASPPSFDEVVAQWVAGGYKVVRGNPAATTMRKSSAMPTVLVLGFAGITIVAFVLATTNLLAMALGLVALALLGVTFFLWLTDGDLVEIRTDPDHVVRAARVTNPRWRLKFVAGGAALVAVGLSFAAYSALGSQFRSSTPSASSSEALAADAWSACKDEVASQLKSPSTAGFPLRYEFPTEERGSTFVMRAWVDAQNSFGAEIRTYFVCTATHAGGSSFSTTVVFQD